MLIADSYYNDFFNLQNYNYLKITIKGVFKCPYTYVLQ